VGAQKKKSTIVLFSVVMVLLFIIAAYFIIGSVIETTINVVSQIRNDEFNIPTPDEKVKEWPLIGERLYNN